MIPCGLDEWIHGSGAVHLEKKQEESQVVLEKDKKYILDRMVPGD